MKFTIYCLPLLLLGCYQQNEISKVLYINNDMVNGSLSLDKYKLKKQNDKELYFIYGKLYYKFVKYNLGQMDFYVRERNNHYKVYIDSIASVLPKWKMNNIKLNEEYISKVYIVTNTIDFDPNDMELLFNYIEK